MSLLVLLLALFTPASSFLRAQDSGNQHLGNDPSDTFLQAYMFAQKAQKFEEDGQYKLALEKYQSAAELLQQIHDKSPDWQPVIVAYRQKKIAESIATLKAKISASGPGSATPGKGDTDPHPSSPAPQPVVTGS